MPNVDDLLKEVAAGSTSAFAELYDASAPLVYGLALRTVESRAAAERATQDAFLDIWEQAPRFEPENAQGSAWIISIAFRRAALIAGAAGAGSLGSEVAVPRDAPAVGVR